MTESEMQAIGREMALAARARGLLLADLNPDPRSKVLIREIYEDAARIVEYRATMKRIELSLMPAAAEKGDRHGR